MCEAKKLLPALFNKTQKLYTFLLHPLANIVTNESKKKKEKRKPCLQNCKNNYENGDWKGISNLQGLES